jgi:hypothetical protein
VTGFQERITDYVIQFKGEIMKSFFSIILFIYSFQSFASDSIVKGFSQIQMQEMTDHNKKLSDFISNNPTLFADITNPLSFNLMEETTVRAFAEFEEAGYLIFSAEFLLNSREVKLKMAEELPADMNLVVYTSHPEPKKMAQKIRNEFKDVISNDRLKVVYMPGGQGNSGFWSRDGLPIPVIRKTTGNEEVFTLVDARYYHKFEADLEFQELFNAQMTKHEFYYEGGNFMANSINECLVINTKRVQEIKDSIFKNHYGCEKLLRLPFVKGIGHADESLKFINDNTVMTDEKSYVKILENNGYRVIMLPRPARPYETYLNSLIVNGVVFVPVFKESNDEVALQIYRDMGFKKVVPLDSIDLSNLGNGSIHCITMTYPKVPLNELLYTMGGSILD